MYRHKLVYLTIDVHFIKCSHIHVVPKSTVHYNVFQGLILFYLYRVLLQHALVLILVMYNMLLGV